jgi:phage-related protein
MYDAQGNMRPIDDIIDDINEGMEGMSAEERNRTITDLAGTYGQMGLSALLASDGIDQMETQMQNSAGAAEVAAGRMGTFRGTVNQLKSSIETLSITVLGPLIEKYLMPLIQTTTEYLNVLTAWLIANPEMAEQLGLVLGVLAGIGPAMIAAGTGLRVLAAGVKGVSLAIGALTSPIGLLIAGAAALYLAYQKNFMGFRDLIDEEVLPKLQELAAWFLEDALPEVVNFLDRKVLPALNALGNWFISDVLPVVVSFVQSYVMPAIQGFFDFLAEAWTYVGPALDMMAAWFLEDMLPAIVSLVENAVIPIFQRFVNFLARMWEYVGPALGDIAAWFLTDALPVILAFISEVFVPALELLGQAFIAIWDVVEPVFFAMMDFLFNEFFPVVGDVIQGIGDLIEELVKAMQSVWADVEGPLAEFGDGVESVMNDVMEVVDDVAGAIGDLIEGFKELTSVTGTSERFTLTADWRDNGDGTMTLYRDGQPVRRVDSEGNIIEEYARGGRFRGNRPMLVGHGEELIVPDSSGLVVNNDQLATALNVLGGQMGGMMEALAGGGAGAGGGDVVLNFGDVVVPLDGMSVAEAREKGGALAESFTEKLERLIRYRGRGVFSG